MTVLSRAVLNKLNDALLHRRIQEGRELLDKLRKSANQMSASDRHAAALVFCLSQWMDIGYGNLQTLDELLAKFARSDRGQMIFVDFIQLKMAEAYRAFAVENAQKAIAELDFVLQIEPAIVGLQVIAQAHFWKGRAHRSQGEYELALQHILKAKDAALELKAPEFVASMKIHESWLLFQKGQRREAFRLLDEAEKKLATTEHYLALGNLESARGRFVRRSGEYAKAVEHFGRAVAIYSRRFSDHPNLARALVNMAYVKRMIALDLRERIGEDRATAAQHNRCREICQEGLELLKQAGSIYSQRNHMTGQGSVFVNAGYLHLDCGDIDLAEDEAEKAYQLGERRQDHILMARARTLQSILHHERAEEQIGDATDTARHAALSKSCSEEAIGIAKMTQNKRLLAGAYIARSRTAAGDFFRDWETAKQFAALAGELLSKDDRDHLSKELSHLKGVILRATGIHDQLRSWSEGIIHDKTFQQVEEEFAEIVIPKVWLREDRKISRVAQKLSISPKKVRRVLRNVNLLEQDE